MRERELADWLRNYRGRPLRLMEVCGTHTASLYRSGLRQLLPESLKLLSGPGCPVCVTPTAYIDRLVEYAFRDHCKVMTFGDMLGVPGSRLSLAGARALGGNAGFFYTPEEVLPLAEREPDTLFVLAAVGFETTAPVWASLVKEIRRRGLGNIRLLTALKTMPEALASLCREDRIDGFLCPGHVGVIVGEEPFRGLAEEYGTTMVMGGFDTDLLLRAVTRLVLESSRGRKGFWNEYPSVVRPEGNPAAQALLEEVFEAGDAVWRGMGKIPGSGLYLKEEYADLDGGSRDLEEDRTPPGCHCSRILLGKESPEDCPLFGKACRPEHPVGACMVSSEGSCCIAWREEGGE